MQLTARYGEDGRQHVRRMFEAAGLAYNPHAEVVPKSLRALCVTELARERGVHKQVHDRLMAAYWEEGRNIGDPEELLVLATEAGLDRAEVEDLLAGDVYLDRVRSSTAVSSFSARSRGRCSRAPSSALPLSKTGRRPRAGAPAVALPASS